MSRSHAAAVVLALLSLPLAVGASGCGPVIIDGGAGGSEEQEQGQGQQPGGEGQSHPGQPSCGSELHILGVYETHSDHGYGNHPPGAASVHVERQGAMVLALSSYEPVHWTVTAEPGAVIEKVIINGYHGQTADVPPGVPVEIYAGPDGSFGAYAYAWPSAEGGSDTQGLVSAVELAAGRPMTSFHGCYQSTAFVLHDDLEVSAACAEDAGYFLTGHVADACGPVDPADPCEGASGMGVYEGWFCSTGHMFDPDSSCQEARANCEQSALQNPGLSFYCTWNGQPIYESEGTPGGCDGLKAN